MRLDVLNKKDEKVVAKLLDLYETSFPASERRDRTKLTDMIGTNDFMRFCAIIDNHDQLAGLFIYWDFPQFVYGEHFAIFPEMRNHGVGRDLLGHLFAITDKPIYIEVEPAEDEMSVRRVEFYRRNGFETVTKDYFQPPYENGGDGLPLWIMAHGQTNAETTKAAVETIIKQVYHDNY